MVKGMQFAEKFTVPLKGELFPSTKKFNVFGEYFIIRAGKIHFQVWAHTFWSPQDDERQ